MFQINYNYIAAQQYAIIMLDKVDDVIREVLKPEFLLHKPIGRGNGSITVNIVVEQNGFTRQFLSGFRKNTGLRDLLQGDILFLKTVVNQVKNDSKEHFIKLTKRKWKRCYNTNTFEDFHTIMDHVFVKCGYEKKDFVDTGNIVDEIGLKICPYCGQSYIGSVQYPRSNGKLHIAKAQIDHYFPKGKYPFLALSYANYVPSCSTCNQSHKHIEDVMDENGRMRMMSPYTFDDMQFKFRFGLKVVGGTGDNNIEVKTEFKEVTPEDKALKKGYQQILGIDKLYEYHNDIVADVIVKKVVDLTAQKLFYQEGLKIDKEYYRRYITAIYGYEPDPKDDRRRLMSKFLRDIVSQVDEMVSYYNKTKLQ